MRARNSCSPSLGGGGVGGVCIFIEFNSKKKKKNPPVIHNEKSKEYALLVLEEIDEEKPL